MFMETKHENVTNYLSVYPKRWDHGDGEEVNGERIILH